MSVLQKLSQVDGSSRFQDVVDELMSRAGSVRDRFVIPKMDPGRVLRSAFGGAVAGTFTGAGIGGAVAAHSGGQEAFRVIKKGEDEIRAASREALRRARKAGMTTPTPEFLRLLDWHRLGAFTRVQEEANRRFIARRRHGTMVGGRRRRRGRGRGGWRERVPESEGEGTEQSRRPNPSDPATPRSTYRGRRRSPRSGSTGVLSSPSGLR